MTEQMCMELPYESKRGMEWKRYREGNYLVLHPYVHLAMALLEAAVNENGLGEIKFVGHTYFVGNRRYYTVLIPPYGYIKGECT